MKRRPKRIYYGPPGRERALYWVVRVSDATRPVKISGDVMHALSGHPGVTIGCGLSNMAIDKSNLTGFPHPVFLASFTKSTALLVDKLNKNGSPAHAVSYAHSYGKITELNDKRQLKKLVQEDPSIIQKEFILRVPRQGRKPTGPQGHGQETGERHHRSSFVPRGALARAVTAGLIGQNVAEQLESFKL